MSHSLPSLIETSLPNSGGVRSGYTTRIGGTSRPPYGSLNLGLHVGDQPEAVHANRKLVAEAAGIRLDQMVFSNQVHGAEISVVRSAGSAGPCDGLVTTEKDLVLCMLAADCALVLLADPERGVIGMCHAGWRGAVAGVAPKTVQVMTSLGASPAKLSAWIGPCIGPRKFEVGPEVAALFPDERVTPSDGNPFVDLSGLVLDQLLAAGLDPANVGASADCTFENEDRYYSYRRDGKESGRMMGFVVRH